MKEKEMRNIKKEESDDGNGQPTMNEKKET